MKEDITCLGLKIQTRCRSDRRDGRKRTAWRYSGRARPLSACPLRSGSWSIRRFWQLRMGDTALLGRP